VIVYVWQFMCGPQKGRLFRVASQAGTPLNPRQGGCYPPWSPASKRRRCTRWRVGALGVVRLGVLLPLLRRLRMTVVSLLWMDLSIFVVARGIRRRVRLRGSATGCAAALHPSVHPRWLLRRQPPQRREKSWRLPKGRGRPSHPHVPRR